MRTSALLVVLVAVASCGCQSPPSLPEGYGIPDSEPAGAIVVSDRLVLVADNQAQNLAPDPVPLLRTAMADRIVATAIRAVQLDLYGQDFLLHVMEDHGQLQPVLHLGDACNLACTGEFDRVAGILSRASAGWVMAPGNHDGYFYGNEDPRDMESWEKASRRGGEPLTKDLLVRRYLWAVSAQEGEEFRSLRRHLGDDPDAILDEDEWHFDGDGPAYLRAVAWRIDRDERWRSFVVQKIDMSLPEHLLSATIPAARHFRFQGIVFDTCQYEHRPGLVPGLGRLNAGVSGEVLSDQLAMARKWVRMADAPGLRWTFFGHHPLKALARGSDDRMFDLGAEAKALLYVSAHSHDGAYLVNRRGRGEAPDEVWLELNVGSTLDRPAEFRTLSYLRDPGEGRIVMRSPVFDIPDLLRDRYEPDLFRPGWEAVPGDADEYLAHTYRRTVDPLKTEVVVKRTLLASYRRLFREIPTDRDKEPDDEFWPAGCSTPDEVMARIREALALDEVTAEVHATLADLVAELEIYEQGRPVADEELRRAFRLSQALWAGKYDALRARMPGRTDRYVVFPVDPAEEVRR